MFSQVHTGESFRDFGELLHQRSVLVPFAVPKSRQKAAQRGVHRAGWGSRLQRDVSFTNGECVGKLWDRSFDAMQRTEGIQRTSPLHATSHRTNIRTQGRVEGSTRHASKQRRGQAQQLWINLPRGSVINDLSFLRLRLVSSIACEIELLDSRPLQHTDQQSQRPGGHCDFSGRWSFVPTPEAVGTSDVCGPR